MGKLAEIYGIILSLLLLVLGWFTVSVYITIGFGLLSVTLLGTVIRSKRSHTAQLLWTDLFWFLGSVTFFVGQIFDAGVVTTALGVMFFGFGVALYTESALDSIVIVAVTLWITGIVVGFIYGPVLIAGRRLLVISLAVGAITSAGYTLIDADSHPAPIPLTIAAFGALIWAIESGNHIVGIAAAVGLFATRGAVAYYLEERASL